MNVTLRNLSQKKIFLVSILGFYLFIASTESASAAEPYNYGWHSEFTSVVSESDTSCGTDMVKEEFVIRDYDTNATTSVSHARLTSYNSTTYIDVSSSEISDDWIVGPVCYNPAIDSIELIIDGGTNHHNYYSTLSWKNGAVAARNKYMQSTVWVRSRTVTDPEFSHLFPLNTSVKSDPVYNIRLNTFPTYYNATAISNVHLFVVKYDPTAGTLGSHQVNKEIAYVSGIGTLTIPQQSIPEGYYIWAYYIKTNGSHPATSGMNVLDTPATGLGWNDFALFVYDKSAPTITSVSHAPTNPYPTDPVVLSASATDDVRGIVRMNIYVDGVLHTQCPFTYKKTASCEAFLGTYPADSVHTYFVVTMDGLANIATSSEQSFTVINPVSELGVSAVNIPVSADTLNSVILSGTVRNAGNAGTGSSFTNLFQKADSAMGANTEIIATDSMNALGSSTEPTSNAISSLNYTFPTSDAGVTKYIRICADTNESGDGVISESDDTNNCSSWTPVVVSPLPNLTSSINTPDSPHIKGTEIQLVAEVKNNNTVPVGSFSNSFTYQWDVTTGTWSPIGTMLHDSLASNGISSDLSAFTPDSEGVLYLRYCVDAVPSAGVIAESNNDDNCTVANIVVTDGATCTGTIDNATLCTGDDTGFVGNVPKIAVGSCTDTVKCEYSCSTGYWLHENNCVPNPTGWLSVTSPIALGGTSIIRWDTSNTDNCRVHVSGDPDWDDIPSNLGGLESSPLNDDTSYVLLCPPYPYALDLMKTVIVNGVPTITTRPRVVLSGNSTNLSWYLNGNRPEDCSLTANGIQTGIDLSLGTFPLEVNARTTYVLTCGTQSDWVMVETQNYGWEN